jgi:hypothetical protein
MAEPDNTTNDDLAKAQEFIKSQVETYMQEAFAKQQPVTQIQPVVADPNQQLRELISPFIDPGINEAKFTGADAKDYVKFYTDPKNIDAAEYQDEVEKAFEALAKVGRSTSRADILRYLRGKEYEADPDKFVAKVAERNKAALERARNAGDIGGSAIDRAKNDTTWTNFGKLSLEDMEKALDGVTF